MANDYCTTTDLKDALVESGLSSTDITSYDNILASCITRASRLIDKETKRTPGAFAVSTDASETRYYNGSGNSQLWIDEMCAAPSAVGLSEGGGVQTSDYDTVASTDYFCWPDNASVEGKPYRRLDMDVLNGAYSFWYRYRKSVKVTGAFGYSYSGSTPDEIKQACINLAARLYKRGVQGYSDVSGAEGISVNRVNSALDKDTAEILAHFKRITI